MRVFTVGFATLSVVVVMSTGCSRGPSSAPKKDSPPRASAPVSAPVAADEFMLKVPGMH